jgi:hypothetical protein
MNSIDNCSESAIHIGTLVGRGFCEIIYTKF